jgi:hypothetical protein
MVKTVGWLGPLSRLLGILGLILLGHCLAFAQNDTAAISGIVRDETGAVVPGTKVILRNLETGLLRQVVTGSNGSYSIPSLPVGGYELTAEMVGFKREVQRGINLVVGQEALLNVTLQVGGIEQQVTVTEAPPLVNATLNSTAGLINETQIKDLPLNGRSFDQLLTLNAGTVNNGSNASANNWSSFSVSGQSPLSNRYLLNGIDYIGANSSGAYMAPLGASGQLLGVEAVREFNVMLNTYGAEYGKRVGAQISIVTTSGTNEIHGDVFEYIRNSVLDARNYFDATTGTPPFQRNQFGGSLGGPLKRNKVFLFGTYEGFRQRLSTSNVAIVPDAEAAQGKLPCYIATSASSCSNPSAFITVPNLKTGMLPIVTNFWPAPNGPELLSNGLPTGTAYQTSNPLSRLPENYGLARFDLTLSEKDSFSSNFTLDLGTKSNPQPDVNFRTSNAQDNSVFSVQETHVFSPTFVNVFSAGYSFAYGSQVIDAVVPIPEDLNFLSGISGGAIKVGGALAGAGVTAIAAPAAQALSSTTRNYFTESDDIHKNKGKHYVSAGAWVQRIQANANGSTQNSAGSVSYSSLLTLLQDLPTSFAADSDPQPVYYRTTEFAFYIQDEMKLSPNFTLRVGLREESTNGWNEAHGHASNYIYDANGIPLTNPVIGSSALQTNNAKALWQPRIGFVWDPSGQGKTSVQAAFGIYNDLQDGLQRQLNNNQPFNGILTRANTPLLSIIPIPTGQAPPATCNADSPLVPPACSIFAPYGVDPNFHTPTLQQWSLTVEQQLTKNLMLRLGYVGSESYHTLTLSDRNMTRPVVCSNASGCLSGGNLAASKDVIVPEGTLYVPPTPGLLPNPYVGPTQTWFYVGTASYHALEASLIKRASSNLLFRANYTFSKALDINSAGSSNLQSNEPTTVLNPYDLSAQKGVSAFNVKHQFNTNVIYHLPFGAGQRFSATANGFIDRLVGGWLWNGNFTAESGFPFTPQVGANTSGTGDTQNPDVPNLNPNFTGSPIVGKVSEWINPNAFVLPLAGTFGNARRGEFIGPNLVEFDTSLIKNFSIRGERVTGQFRAEAFNILNHANFATPNPIMFSGTNYSSSAGVITATATTSRQLQFALKIMF